MRRFISALMCCLLMTPVFAEPGQSISVHSPDSRVALLELYTSQGCSSCPPAERWLSRLKDSGVSSQQIIPLAFHVTYWDYIGWRDRFGASRYDDRQRRIAAYNASSTIYTPQFVLAGSDYRNLGGFGADVQKVISQPSSIDLEMTVQPIKGGALDVFLTTGSKHSGLEKVYLYLAVYEHDLQSHVDDGENEGEWLHHDYVVRRLYGPVSQPLTSKPVSIKRRLSIDESWKKPDLNLVVFAEHPHSGEILQAVSLELARLD